MNVIPYVPQLACCSDVQPFWFSAYVMVEWFAAKADGTTDDADAWARALADGRPIALDARKTYAAKNVTVGANSACPGIFSFGGQARVVAPPGSTSSDAFFIVRKPSNFAVVGVHFDMPFTGSETVPPPFSRALWFQPDGNTGTNYRVENCRFSGGAAAVTGIGYIIRNSRFAGNYVTGTYGDGLSFNCLINVEIVDNILELTGIGTGDNAPSGAIRIGTSTQLDTSLNVTIARNTISLCCIAAQQSAIDCFSGAARNLRVTDNICSYNGAGIELKTMIWTQPSPPPPGASDVYEHNVVANNTIRLFSDRNTTGITVFHAQPGAAKGKAKNVHIFGNMISSTVPVTVGAFVHVAISVSGHDYVTIGSNKVFNVDKGIIVGGVGPVGDTADHIDVSGNTVDVAGVAFQHSGGTVNNLYIRSNPLLRAGAATTSSAVVILLPCSDLDIADNRIEALARWAIELRAVSGGRVTDNTLIGAVHALLTQSTGVSNIRIRDNEAIAATGPAFNLGTGTGIEVQGNQVEVPAGSSTVSGAASYTAADNCRGMVTSDPTTTYGGALGDYFDNSATGPGDFSRFVCTTAGGAGVAVFKGSGAIDT